MSDQTASAVMTSPFVSVNPEVPITDAAKTMRDATIGSVMVVDEANRPEGILTRSDFVDFVADEENLAAEEIPATAEVIATDIVSVSPETPLPEVADVMSEHAIHHLPVISGSGKVVGIVTTTDLANAE
ncbi:MAG: histidine kinase [Halobacteriales archaeon SW_9_67_25]|jgi:CBS domain-containing protein|nr:MAG: histidine kinase [Halobacteriales archaeon SW_9_67_25]